ncbi:ribosome maturation protein SBDS-like [Bradysia coprophila]|uniref:ribosome maturation protein SBDS-like n=1 Tax=Bradysia coprophila TaxID=38358 RepID=UPI00187DCE27|nr:ribosome maturation protein SBDS-like [Bradysia coprophila]
MSKVIAPTNEISVVRLKKCGKRFEVACHKDNLLSWRNNIEKDIDDVLRSRKVFLNVSKRQMAKNTDLMAAFNTDNVDAICKEILEKGELQVTERERHSQSDSLFKDIATNISNECVNSETKCPYTVEMIEQALKDIRFSVKPHQTVAQQTIEATSLLKKSIPIERTNMRIKIAICGKDAKKMKDKIVQHCSKVEEESWNSGNLTLVGIIVPGSLRIISDIISADSKGTGKLDVLILTETDVIDDEAVEVTEE